MEFTATGSVLVFVTRKVNSEEVATSLRGEGHQGNKLKRSYKAVIILSPLSLLVGLLHGDMSQGDRDKVITTFKKKEFPILVATDVAGKVM